MTIANALQGTVEERNLETKTLIVTMIVGKRPEIKFTGFWNGKMLQAAMNSIAKAYRTRRHDVVNTERRKEKEKGNGEKKI